MVDFVVEFVGSNLIAHQWICEESSRDMVNFGTHITSTDVM